MKYSQKDSNLDSRFYYYSTLSLFYLLSDIDLNMIVCEGGKGPVMLQVIQ